MGRVLAHRTGRVWPSDGVPLVPTSTLKGWESAASRDLAHIVLATDDAMRAHGVRSHGDGIACSALHSCDAPARIAVLIAAPKPDVGDWDWALRGTGPKWDSIAAPRETGCPQQRTRNQHKLAPHAGKPQGTTACLSLRRPRVCGTACSLDGALDV